MLSIKLLMNVDMNMILCETVVDDNDSDSQVL